MVKKPICNYSGKLKELQSGDTLPGGGAAGDIALTMFAPVTNETIPAGYSGVVVGPYVVAAGTILTIEPNARFRIL